MKKLLLYSLFVIVALGSFTASGLTLTVNVDDPERLTLDIDYETFYRKDVPRARPCSVYGKKM